MFRGFDGGGANFGDISVATRSSDVSKAAAYVSQDSSRPGRTVIVAINRSEAANGANSLCPCEVTVFLSQVNCQFSE